MGVLDEWSEMSLKKKKKKKEMKFVWKEERLSEKNEFGWKWVEIEKKWGKNEHCSCGGLERENGGREGVVKKMKCAGKWGGTVIKNLARGT